MTRPFQLSRNALGQLIYSADLQPSVVVVPVRAFPIAAPEEGISLVGSDGREVMWIQQLAALPPEPRQLLLAEIVERDFVPQITRIVAVSTYATPSTWTVQTDRGETSLLLKSEDDIRRLSHSSLLIASASGVQFSVPHVPGLDKQSKRFLERFL